ncbi:hypothetical protein Tco_0278274 [Tanacetum coccineum]
MSFITYSNPLFDLDEEIISSEFNPIHNEDPDSTPKNDRFDAKSYLLESLVNCDTLMVSPPKIDFVFDEFTDELTHLQSIPPGIDNINLDPEGNILFLESLLYDNSSPRPPEAFQANSNTIIESLPISVNTLREEIDIFSGPDDSIPPGIESDDFDSEDDDNSTSLTEFESFHVDYPDSGDLTIDVVEDIPIDVPNILPTHPALQLDFDFIPSHNDLGSDLDNSTPSGDRNKMICIEVESTRFLATHSPVINTLLLFSSKNEDKVFNHGVLVSKDKSPSSSSHRGLKASKLFHQKSPMLKKIARVQKCQLKLMKVRTIPDAITEGSWGFEHTKKVFLELVIPFINSLRASFKDFDNALYNELKEVKTVYNQMEAVVEQCSTPKRMFKLDLEPLSPKVLKNKDAHIDYIKHTQENVDILQELVKHARVLRPLDSELDSTYKYAKRIQEVLVYIIATCPSLTKPSEKLVAITPLNKNKKFRFVEPATSPRMKSSTSASRSQTLDVKHSMLNANSELTCATCNKCMFDTIHDLCVLDFVNDVNGRSTSNSAKKSKKKTTWKPTGKVFTNVGYKWIPTCRKFIMDGNICPLTRITSTNVVLKEW